MSNNSKKTLAAAIGAAFVSTVAISPVASADANPFAVAPLADGYKVAASGSCGAGSCGSKGSTEKEAEASCGDKDKAGSCGENKDKAGSCGENKDKAGSCGENKDKEGNCSAEKDKENGCSH